MSNTWRKMATRDLLDYIDDSDGNQLSTPSRESLLSGTSKSCLSSSRKSGKFRKLYTPEDKAKLNENRRYSTRRSLLSISHTATIGNASHIDTSLDVVDTTPCVETTKSHISLVKSLHNQTSAGPQGDNEKSTIQSKLVPLCDVVAKSRSDLLSPINSETKNVKEQRRNNLKGCDVREVSISGITSLMKTPVSKSSKMSTSEDFSSDSLSSTSTETPGQFKSNSSNCRISKRVLITPEISHSGDVFKTIRKEEVLQTPGRVINGQEINNIEEMIMQTPKQAKFLNGLAQDGITEVIHKMTPSNYQSSKIKTLEIQSRSHQSFSNPLKSTEEDLPPTQPISALLFKDIIAYVEVRFGGDNRSSGIKAHLRSLGATVRDKFTNDVTHVIFNEGLLSTYKKAMKKNIHLVSVIWIEECKKAQNIVSERLYPPCDMERYESPHLLKKFRKVRSFQPDFEERGEQKRRRQRKKTAPEKESEPEIELPECFTYKKRIKVPNFLENASKENELVRALLTVADIGPEYEDVINRPTSPTLSEEEDMPNPPTLAVRLLRKMLTPKSSPEVDSRNERHEVSDHTPQNSSCPVVEETPKRQLISFTQSRHLLNPEQTVEKEEIFKTPINCDKISMSSNSKRNSEILIKSPKFGRNNKVSQKLSKSSINNTADTDIVEEEISREISSSGCEKVVLTTAHKDENSNKCYEKNNERKGTKRRYSTLNEIGLKISKEKCSKQLVTLSKTGSGLNKNNASQNEAMNESKSSTLKVTEKNSNGMSTKKRKLMTLHRTDTPEELEISNIEEETTITSVCPYSPEDRPEKKRKIMSFAGESNKMILTPCVASTLNGESTKKRKIKIARKKCDFYSGDKDEIVSKVGCSSRSSSGEFVAQVPQITLTENETKPHKAVEKKLPSLVCTSLQRHDVEVVAAVVNKLGGFVMEAKVSANTTHVVTSGPKRTLNVLKGIARGCWIVLQEWVLRSLESEKWLDEDDYELSDFSPAVQQCRIERLSFGRYYKQDLFSSCGAIYVSSQSTPPKQDLEDLIKLCGGHVVSARRSADLMVGNPTSSRYNKLKCISEKWVLDSIQFFTLRPFIDYEI